MLLARALWAADAVAPTIPTQVDIECVGESREKTRNVASSQICLEEILSQLGLAQGNVDEMSPDNPEHIHRFRWIHALDQPAVARLLE